MQIFLWIMIVFLFLYCWQVVKGPSIWDRLLGMNIVSTKIIIIIIFFAAAHELAYLLDFAIIYALFGFIGTIFIALFLAERGRSDARRHPEGSEAGIHSPRSGGVWGRAPFRKGRKPHE